MEATTPDPFAAGADNPEEDPFADTGMEADMSDPSTEVGAAEQPPAETPPAAPPIVNKEGEEVAPPPGFEGEGTTPPPDETPPTADGEAAKTPADGEGEKTPPETPAAAAPRRRRANADNANPLTRLYKVLYQTDSKQWTEADLSKVPEGVPVKKSGEKGDDELWLVARNQEQALSLAFAVCGSPEKGCTVWPVPRGAYRPKRVKPKPPEPARQRLDIS